MAICKDCIAAGVLAPAVRTPPCEGLTFTLKDVNGRIEASPAYIRDNPLSLVGYDILFDFGGKTYEVVYSAPNWLILAENGTKVWASPSAGPSNDKCPPKTGWFDVSSGAYFTSVGVDYLVAPGPSEPCTVTNGTFDSNSTGWTVTNGAWSATFGGAIIFDNALLGALSQASVLTIGETYTISINYSTSTRAGFCTPTQLDAAYIKIYAGTNVYTQILDDTSGGFTSLEVELTCEGNTTLKVEIFDPNQCYGTITGSKGRAIDNICAVKTTIVTDPTGEDSPLPSVEYKDVAEVPVQVNGVDYNTKLSQYQECLATKGTTFYNKVIGAVKCDYRELTKLKLIIELLAQKNEDKALDCIYTGESIPTAVYKDPPVLSLSGSTECGGNFTITLTQDGVVNGKPAFKGEVPPGEFACDQEIGIYYDSGQSRWEATLNGTFYNDYLESTGDYPVGGPWQGTVISITLTQCINNCEPPSKPPATFYLETFINFANRFCADCMVTGPAPTPTAPTTPSLEILKTSLTSETGITITTEFNQKITI